MSDKYNTLDMVKFIMSILVVLIHAAPLVEYEGYIGYVVNQGVTRIAVPFFFIVSGFFLYHTINKDKFMSWSLKIVKMYVLWSIFYLPVSVIYLSTVSELSITQLIANRLMPNILFGYYHLWFLPAMIMGGFILYTLSTLSNKKLILLSSAIYFTSCFLWYGVTYGIPIVNSAVVDSGYLRTGMFFGFPLMCAGYLIAKNQSIKILKNKKIMILLLLLSFILLISEATYNFNNRKILGDILFSVPFVAVTIFILSLYKSSIPAYVDFGFMSKDIYYIHVVFLMFWGKFTFGIPHIILTFLSSVIYSLVHMSMRRFLVKK